MKKPWPRQASFALPLKTMEARKTQIPVSKVISEHTESISGLSEVLNRTSFSAASGCALGFEGKPYERFAIGADLGGTNLRVAAVTAAGDLLEQYVAPTSASGRDREEILEELCEAIERLAERHRGPSRLLAGVGVGIAGILDGRTGVLRGAPTLPGWKDFPVRAALERRLSAPLVLDNDANAAAVGEHWRGAARGADSVCMLTLGTGVGGGLVLGGKLWRGTNGMAAEFGHIAVRPDGPRCGCGSRGCLQQYASATAVERMARAAPELARALEGVPEGAVARRVGELGKQGVAVARAIFHEVGVALGIAVAGLVNALDLPVYVIGGGVSEAWDLFSPSLFAELRRRSFVYATTAPEIGRNREATLVVRAAMPKDSGLYGAARLALLHAQAAAHWR
jgi:glucokinase